MKPNREKDHTKKGTFPLRTSRNIKPGDTNNPKKSKSVEVTPSNNSKLTRKRDDPEEEAEEEASTKTPTMEASVSPEIQMMLKKTPATTTDHHISGISEKRKCRARGLLSASNDGESASQLPSHASMHWLNNQSPTLPFASPSDSSPTSSTSANIIRTPASADSDSSSVTYLNNLLLSKTSQSFEFDSVPNAALPSSSVDLTYFRSGITDIDHVDCCRCLSDDEDRDVVVFDDIVSPLGPQNCTSSGYCSESIGTDGDFDLGQ